MHLKGKIAGTGMLAGHSYTMKNMLVKEIMYAAQPGVVICRVFIFVPGVVVCRVFIFDSFEYACFRESDGKLCQLPAHMLIGGWYGLYCNGVVLFAVLVE